MYSHQLEHDSSIMSDGVYVICIYTKGSCYKQNHGIRYNYGQQKYLPPTIYVKLERDNFPLWQFLEVSFCPKFYFDIPTSSMRLS